MEPARPRSPRRRPRRGPATHTVDVRLVRNAALLLLAPLLLLMFTTSRPGPLPGARPATGLRRGGRAAAHDRARARLPEPRAGDGRSGSRGRLVPGAARAVRADRDRRPLAGGRAGARRDGARQPDRRSCRARRARRSSSLPTETTAVPAVARTTTPPARRRWWSSCAGTRRTGTLARRLEPTHTLVFLSSDGGAYGALGAERFATTSPLARQAVAVLTLDGLAGRAWPRLEIAAPASRSPAPALVRTATVRTSEQLAADPARPGLLTQLVDLALPFGYGEQAPFLVAGRSALRLSTAQDASGGAGDEPEGLSAQRLGQLGRAAETTLASLDGAIQLSGRSAAFVYLGDRVVRGWAVELLLLVGARALRRCRDRPARTGRAPRHTAGARVETSAAQPSGCGWRSAGSSSWQPSPACFRSAAPRPPVADAPPIDQWPVAGVARPAGSRGRAVVPGAPRGGSGRAGAEDDLGGYTVAFSALAIVSAVIAVVNPFALVFVLPSLYSWLWLPALRGRGWPADLVFGLGLTGPVACRRRARDAARARRAHSAVHGRSRHERHDAVAAEPERSRLGGRRRPGRGSRGVAAHGGGRASVDQHVASGCAARAAPRRHAGRARARRPPPRGRSCATPGR